MNSAYYFEELQVGQAWTSARRTVTESDIVIFAGMTGDYDRAHVDHDYASKSRFKQPLMHGMMGLAWVAGLSTTAPAVQTLALVSVDQWNFMRPVHIGDTVYAVTEVVELAKGGRSAGKVTWRKSLLNQHDEVVQTGLFVSLVELRPKLGRGRVPAPHQSSLTARPIPSGSLAATPAPVSLAGSSPTQTPASVPAQAPASVPAQTPASVLDQTPLESPVTETPSPAGSLAPVDSVSSETATEGAASAASGSDEQTVVDPSGDRLRELPAASVAPATGHPSASVEA